MRFALALSVALNLLLLTSIVAARIDPARDDLAAVGELARTIESGMAPLRGGAPSAAELREVLEGAGLGSDVVKALVLGWLEAGYRAAYAAPAPRYWEAGYSAGRDALVADSVVDSAVRAALVELFGAEATGDPAFDAVFRPLGPAYAFLGSGAQVSLQAHRLELLSGMPGGAEAPAAATSLCRAVDARAAAPPGVALPPSGLSAEEDREYRLRFSPLAAQLRDAGIADGEAEFRRLFDLVRQLEQPMGPSAQARVRAELRARIGNERFDRFWSMRDPVFAVVGEHLAREGVPEYQRRAAYSIVNRSQEALLSLLGGDRDAGSIAAASLQVEQDEAAALSRLLGAESAGRLEAAISEISLRLSQGSAGC